MAARIAPRMRSAFPTAPQPAPVPAPIFLDVEKPVPGTLALAVVPFVPSVTPAPFGPNRMLGPFLLGLSVTPGISFLVFLNRIAMKYPRRSLLVPTARGCDSSLRHRRAVTRGNGRVCRLRPSTKPAADAPGGGGRDPAATRGARARLRILVQAELPSPCDCRLRATARPKRCFGLSGRRPASTRSGSTLPQFSRGPCRCPPACPAWRARPRGNAGRSCAR